MRENLDTFSDQYQFFRNCMGNGQMTTTFLDRVVIGLTLRLARVFISRNVHVRSRKFDFLPFLGLFKIQFFVTFFVKFAKNWPWKTLKKASKWKMKNPAALMLVSWQRTRQHVIYKSNLMKQEGLWLAKNDGPKGRGPWRKLHIEYIQPDGTMAEHLLPFLWKELNY